MTARSRIRLPRRGVTLVAPVLAVLAILLGLTPTGGDDAAAAAGVSISPLPGSSSLRAGDQIRVTWNGMAPGPVSLYLCADPEYLASQKLAATNSCQLSSRTVATTGADGSGSADFQLWWQLKSARTGTLNCLSGRRCAVRVTTCPHNPERSGAHATIPGMDFEEDEETGDLVLPTQYRYRRPVPVVEPAPLPLPKPTTRPKVNGAGGTGIQLAIEAWRAHSLGGNVGVDATYAPRFFDEGYKFVVDGSNDFAIASVPLRGDLMHAEEGFAPFEAIEPGMSPERQRAQWDAFSRDLIYVPLVASPLDVIYDHAPFGIEHEALDLDGRSLARMFSGGRRASENESEITAIDMWNDPAIVEQNAACPPAGLVLGSNDSGLIPNENASAVPVAVRATNRSDASESNVVLREWLRAAAPDLSTSLGPPSADAFKDAIGKIEVTGSKDMANSFSALNENLVDPTKIPTPGRIGYVDHAFALRYADRVARLKNGAGEYVAPNDTSATVTLETATVDAATGLVAVGDGGATPGAYPLVQVYYAAISPSAFLAEADTGRIDALRDFLAYAISDEGQAAAAAAGYTPLTSRIRAVAASQVAKIHEPGAAPPPTTVPTSAPAPAAVAADGGGFDFGSDEGTATGGFGSVSSGSGTTPTGSYGTANGYSTGSGGSDYEDSTGSYGDGDYSDGSPDDAPGVDDGAVTIESPSALEVLGEVIARPIANVADILRNPARSPGLFSLMVVGGASCVVGPILYRRRPKRAPT